MAESAAASAVAAADGGDGNAGKKAHSDQDALSSMRFAYKMCFVAVAADVVIAIIDDSVFRNKPFTWVEAVGMFDSLNLLVFGLGLRRATKLYRHTLKANKLDVLDVRMDTVRDLCRTMARIWRTTAWSLVGVSVSLAATLREHSGDGLATSRGASAPGMIEAPVEMLVVAALGSIAIRRWSAQNVLEAITAKEKWNDLSSPSEGAEKARSEGVRNCLSMNLCMGSFALLGLMQLATWVVMPANIMGRIFTVFNFITPFTITGLLLSLSRSHLRALMVVTSGGTSTSGGGGGDSFSKENVYDDLFQAQTEFFTKIGKVLRSAAAFGLLPYGHAAVMKFVPALLGRPVG